MKKLAFLGLILLLCGCTAIVIRADQEGATNEGVLNVVSANNEFAIEFYNNIKEGEEGNIFFSPYSLTTALGMTYEGARGETAEEMRGVLHLINNDSLRRPSTGAVYNIINTPKARYIISTANALWMQENFSIKKDYVDLIGRFYMGDVRNMDFVNKAEESRIIINDWVEDHTNNKITDLIPPGALGPLTRLVLTNAIYFKGDWLHQFDKGNTRNGTFNTGEINVTVPMMKLFDTDLKFNYTEDDEAQVLEMQYKGSELSMLVILPKGEMPEITTSKLGVWRRGLRSKVVDIMMPKFKFETKYFLKENLIEMGMPSAFDGVIADFSGMSDIPLVIDEVIHQAYVAVDEEGTEAAAATAVIIKETAMPMYETFNANHPFIFIIQERSTGAIVFMGRVVNPAE